MKDYKKSVKLSLALTYLLMLAAIVFVITLPFIATWYVEKMKRPADLATVTMLSCYPCVPFAAVFLISLRNFLKNLLKDNILSDKNLSLLKRMVLSLFFAGIIMIVAGFFYKPFFISGGSAMFCALVFKIVRDILSHYINKEKKD